MNGKKPGIGLFLCRCGTNIANFVDLEEISVWAGRKNGVAFVEFHDLLCSPAGKAFTEEKIREKGADYYVVAACSPKMHDKTFQRAASSAGANMADIHMANIREQCGWVTPDRDVATGKAKSIINAALERIVYHEDLQQSEMEVLTDIVVIGGGLAGIEAALMAAGAGRKVTIIEKEISLGGEIIRVEEVAPNMECAPCLLAPRLSAVRDNPNIRVISHAELQDVIGFFGNYTVRVRKKARYVNESCIGCEECFAVCPVSYKSGFHLGLGEKKAVYTQFPGSVPAMAAINKDVCKHFIDGSCEECRKVCPFGSIDFEEQDEEIEVKAGAVIVATGSGSVDASVLSSLGYGSVDNVYTMPEFERIASSNGPFGGTITMKNGEMPESVAVIHCAGSLCKEGLEYCSGTCCTLADKVGEMFRKQDPRAKVYSIHDQLVFAGPQAHSFHQHQVSEGTAYLKTGDLSSVSVKAAGGKIEVRAEGVDPVEVDMVVLATGIAPAKGAGELAAMLNIERDKYGFFKSDHSILHATGSTLDGINLAGPCASPCSAEESVTRAQAAAGDALSKLVPGKKIALEVMTCSISGEDCAGCKLCISVCPYKAISFDGEKGVSRINEAICRGCGTCAASCPSQAATAKHFTREQIYAEIGGALNG